jgi:hypothetical protein
MVIFITSPINKQFYNIFFQNKPKLNVTPTVAFNEKIAVINHTLYNYINKVRCKITVVINSTEGL